MSSDASPLQFSRHVWQAVHEHAKRCLQSRDFDSDLSKIENLRCVHFEEEIESCYGRQLWYFESLAISPGEGAQKLFGAMEFSVQYGLLEACQAALFEDSDHRQRFLHAAIQPIRSRLWDQASTHFWVRMVVLSLVAVVIGWLLMLAIRVS